MLIAVVSGCSKQKADGAPPSPRTDTPALPDGKGGIHKTGNPYKVSGRWYTPMKSVSAYDETGIASWYGDAFHGKRTANGEWYDMYTLSAAHKTLPLPTLVRVTNLENGRSVIVRVNDRGPFVKDRLIDLSYAAANSLGYMHNGTARVRVQTLDQSPVIEANTPPQADTSVVAAPPLTPPPVFTPPAAEKNEAAAVQNSAGIFVQLGAFGSEDNANRMRDSLLTKYPSVFLAPKQVADQKLYRVRIGPFIDMQQIEETMISLQKNGYSEAVVVIE
ncbi:septal ring lytic transglycosylase RlpA family protein [Mariprofundus ferrinatatus]|uniref:septal ring lytic transglycosylase RlpA family protein n=1 Tax=Mariprofundus ferrinatatus TaxID=1921087 RepID=UPI0018E239FC|nr:septal ring lytic transglycosylase RlpA family protein [Mariprofundus ferrinatatus]